MRNRTFVLSVFLAFLMILSSCTASFPKKDSIASLTNEEATDALKGRTEKEMHENWGDPDGMLSGFYGDIYDYNDRRIVIYYDADSKVTDVLVSDK